MAEEVNEESVKREEFEKREEQIKTLLDKSEISLSLDSYDDIFSDFDPRPYSERALSDDFLLESKKAARDKVGTLELKFLLPAHLRKPSIEFKIKKRLREHFKKHHFLLEKEEKEIVSKGILIAIVGFFLMIVATVLYDVEATNFLLKFIRIVIEPAGWFIVWFGLDQISTPRMRKSLNSNSMARWQKPI